MIENHKQESLLIRYADNQASAAECEQVIDLIRNDQSAADFLKMLQQTALPAPGSDTQTANAQTVELINNWQPTPTARRFGVQALAASLIAGLAIGSLATRFIVSDTDQSAAMIVDATPEWIRLVADYHKLYARQTIEGFASVSVAKVNTQVSEWLERETQVPLLDEQNIVFKRAQQLTVHNDVLVQLAYLPQQSNPIAICIRKMENTETTKPNIADYNGMRYAQWQDDYHAVVIVGELPEDDLRSIAQQVSESLFGSV